MIETLKKLKIIHVIICMGTILAYIFAGNYTMAQLKGNEITSEDFMFLIIPIAAFVGSNLLYKSVLKQVDSQKSIEENMPIYQAASVTRWALLEGGALVILFLKPNLVIFGIAIIVYMIFLYPTTEKITTDFQSKMM